MANRVFPSSDPTLSDVLNWHKRDIKQSLNCCMVGKINAFDATQNTATVQIMSRLQYMDGTEMEYPLLTDCPVFTLQGGGAYINMPISAGDYCIVLFNDRSLDDWWVSGKPMPPTIPHSHSMSDGIALVGIQPLTALLPISDSKFGLRGGGKKISISNDLADLKTQLDNIMTILGKIVDAPTVQGSTIRAQATTLDPLFSTTLANISTSLGNLMETGP